MEEIEENYNIIKERDYHDIDKDIADLAKENLIFFCLSNYNVDNFEDIDYLRISFYIMYNKNINPLVSLFYNAIIKEFLGRKILIKKFVKSVQEQYKSTKDKNNFFLNY